MKLFLTLALCLITVCCGCESAYSRHDYVLCHRPAPAPIAKIASSPPMALPTDQVAAPPKKRQARAKEHSLLIIIDPGHGGEDLGAKSKTRPIYSEKNFNLVTAKFLQDNLEQMGFRTTLTRSKDIFIPLDKRAAEGVNPDCEIFVSVHYNAAESPDARGIEVYYFDDAKDETRTKSSKALAQAVLHQVVTTTGAKSRGVKHGNYHVIRESTVPAILVEGGFLTHPDELARIKDPGYLKKIAWGIAQGIAKYAGNS